MLTPRYIISRLYFLSVFLITLFAASCHSSSDFENSLAQLENVAKSPNDRREYRALVLENKLKVLLISDPESDKAAAAVDVNSGSNSDPKAFQGLAHFLEHMLFLGTEKYPEAGEYQEFIGSHGGSHNAYTAFENTSYYFDIEESYLAPALDRFSQFFIAPLFSPEYVDRERNAVNSEYQSNLQNDGRRSYSALKAILNKQHPLSQFSVGSLETLRDKPEGDLRDALLTHYDDNYSANLMSLAILGTESLNELEGLVRQYFASIKNRKLKAPRTQEPLFNAEELPALLEIVPVRDSRSLSYTFPIPVVKSLYKSKPLNYLGNLIGHEGQGSLLSLLKEKGWVNNLSAGGGMSYADNATFSINVGLTEQGVNHVDDITQLIFQFIELVKQEGMHEWLFNEQKVMAELSFKFQETAPPSSLVGALSRRLQEYPANEVNTVPYDYDKFSPEKMLDLLSYIRTDNVLLTFISKTIEGNKIEPLFGAHYRYSSLPQDRVEGWQVESIDPNLAIAGPNPFMPENLTLKPAPDSQVIITENLVMDKPKLIFNKNGASLWFKQDQEFNVPRANFFVYAMTPLFSESLENSLLSSFVVSLVNDKLNEYSYPANLAGVFYGVSRRARGFTLRVGGYDDKQAVLLEELLKAIVAADFSEERFDIIKAEMIRGLENADKQMPYVRLFQEAQALIVSPYWSEQQRMDSLATITFDQVIDFVPKMLTNLKIEGLYHGNVVEKEAIAMMEMVTKYLNSSSEVLSPPFSSVVKLPKGMRVLQEIEVEHEDSAIVILMQGPDDSLQTQATINLLGSILRSPFYDRLRTEKQLGYVVNATTMPLLKTNALVFYIESPNTDPIALEANINDFLFSYIDELEAMSPMMFNDIKAGLLNNLRQQPQRMSGLSGRYWSDILIEEYETDSTLLMADAIEALNKEQIVAYYQQYIAGSDTARLVARSVGSSHESEFLANKLLSTANLMRIEESDSSYQAFKDSSEHFYFNKRAE